MNHLDHNKYLLAVFAASLFCACALPARKTPSSGAPGQKETAVRKEAEVPLSPEDTRKVESLYYKAVGAYSSNDMAATIKYLDEISLLYPSCPPALDLRAKVKSVAGNSPSAPQPQRP